jgi:hypothetical protein
VALAVMSAKVAAESGLQSALGAQLLYGAETWWSTSAFSKVSRFR